MDHGRFGLFDVARCATTGANHAEQTEPSWPKVTVTGPAVLRCAVAAQFHDVRFAGLQAQVAAVNLPTPSHGQRRCRLLPSLTNPARLLSFRGWPRGAIVAH